MKKSPQSFSILFWLNKQRCKNGKPVIYLRLTVDQKRIELATRQYVDPKLWNQEAQCVKSNSEEARTINRQLIIMKAELHKHYSYLLALDKPVDAETLKNQYLGIGEKQRTICEAFDLHNKRFAEKVSVSKKSATTLKRLEITKQKVIAFLRYQFKVSDKSLDDIRFSFASDFEHYLSTVQKIGSNTSMKYIKNVKQVLKMAADQGWIPVNPLSGFKCSYDEPQRERLTMEEIMKLYNKDLQIARLEEVRDVYLFCCFTGYAYQDVLNLTKDHIISGIDSEKWIVKNREKNDNPERVPLLPLALEIINKYKSHPYCEVFGRLLPVNSNARFNGYLKEVAAICGIKKHLTTHTARHTFATTVTLEHDVSLETVSQMLGHRSIRTTQLYSKITQRKISNNMKELKNRLFDGGKNFRQDPK